LERKVLNGEYVYRQPIELFNNRSGLFSGEIFIPDYNAQEIKIICRIHDITELQQEKEINATLRESVEKLDSGFAIYDSHTNQYLYANQKAFEMFGEQQHNLEKNKSENILEYVIPEDMPKVEKILHHNFTEGKTLKAEYRIKVNGKIKTIASKRTAFHYNGRDCVFVYFDDITKEREQENRINLLKAAHENLNMPVWIASGKNENKKLVYLNNV